MRTAPLTALVVVLMSSMLLSVVPPSSYSTPTTEPFQWNEEVPKEDLSPAPSSQPQNFAELVANRTRHSKTFQDGVLFRLDASVSPLHWLNGSTWEDINSTIVPSTANVPDLGLADLEMTEDAFEWFALDTFNTIPLLLFRNKSALASHVTFNPQALQWTNDLDQLSVIAQPVQGILAEVSNSTLLWQDAYGSGRNLSITLEAGRMTKHLILDAAPPDPPQFVIDGGNPVMELQFIFATPSGPDAPDIRVDGTLWDQSSTVSTGQEVIFESSGSPIFVFRAPTAFDAGENETSMNMTLSKQGQNLRVGLRLPLPFIENATYPLTMDPTINVDVNAGTDDAEERVSSGTMDLTSGDLEMAYNGGNEQLVGLRFNAVGIPQASTITSASIQFTSESPGIVGSPVLIVVGQDADNTTTFTSSSGNISGRPQTTAFTDWSPTGAWTPGDRTADQRTPSIASVVQEIVDRSGWVSGASMVYIVKDNGSASTDFASAESYNGAPSEAATLSVTYTAVGEILLTSPTLDPLTGSPSTLFNFTIDYNQTLGTPAFRVAVNVSDATNGTFLNLTMTRIGPGPNATYFHNTSLPVGFFTHFFWANTTDPIENRTGDLLGPTVTLVPPVVVTDPASPVLGLSARLRGNLTALGDASTVNVSFQWGDTMALGNATIPEESLTATGTFSFDLTGLMTSTQYFFRARANDSSVVFGAILNFTTEAAFVPPDVTTEPANVLSQTTAILRGSTSDFGELNITMLNVSFEWGFSPLSLPFETPVQAVLTPASFEATLTDLEPGVTVFFRAKGEFNPFVFGAILTFTTEAGLTGLPAEAQFLVFIGVAIWLVLVGFSLYGRWPWLLAATGILGVVLFLFLASLLGALAWFAFILVFINVPFIYMGLFDPNLGRSSVSRTRRPM